MLTLEAGGWTIHIVCTLNPGHSGAHIGPVYQAHDILSERVSALKWSV